MSARVRPSGSSASVMTCSRSWVSDWSVWRTMGVCAQPTTAMSVCVAGRPSEDPVHEVGVVDVGLAVRHPAEEAARRRRPCCRPRRRPRPGRPTRRRPAGPTRTSSAGSSIVGWYGEDHVGAVEEHEDPGERLGLGLPRVLHRRDDREVRDRAGLAAGRPRGRGRAPPRRSGSSRGRRRRPARTPGTAGPSSRFSREAATAGSARRRHRVPVGDRREVVHQRDRLVGRAGVVALDLGLLARARSRRCRRCGRSRVPRQRGATRRPTAIASGEPASTACSSGVVAPSRRMKANANGRSSGCCIDGSGTQVHDSTVPAGPDLHEVVGELGAGRRVPLHRRDEHRRHRCGSRGSASR